MWVSRLRQQRRRLGKSGFRKARFRRGDYIVTTGRGVAGYAPATDGGFKGTAPMVEAASVDNVRQGFYN